MNVIIGAGISGLSVANNLNQEFIILEKADRCGGLSSQYQENGYWFDYGGHYFHFKNRPVIKTYLEKFSAFRNYHRKSKIFLGNKLVPFPLQTHLSFLPRSLARTILNQVPEHPIQQGKNLKDILEYNFGNCLYRLFFQPFLEKYYLRSPEKLMASMDKGSIPLPDKETMIESFEGKRFDVEGYNPIFYYPKVPLRNFIAKMVAPVKNHIKLNEEVELIDLKKKRIHTRSNRYEYDRLINTLPLKEFLGKIHPNHIFPEYLHLENISTRLTNVVLKRRNKRFHWVYIPQRNIPFYRVGFYPTPEPPICYLEESINLQVEKQETKVKIQKIIFTLKQFGIIGNQKDIIYISQKIIPVSYIIFNLQWKKTVPAILTRLEKLAVYSIGRYGSWNYSSMSEDVQNAINIAVKLNNI
jgi:protoporphyrinogen oxidase